MSIKDERIEELMKWINNYNGIVKNIEEVLTALASHQGKLVDIRFFNKHFSEKIDGSDRTYTKYRIVKSRYSYQSSDFELYIGDSEYVQIKNRETKHIIGVLSDLLKARKDYSIGLTERLWKLEKIDDVSLMNELRDLFFKYDEPIIWQEILKDYTVQCPSKND